jgi:hypothetical protein
VDSGAAATLAALLASDFLCFLLSFAYSPRPLRSLASPMDSASVRITHAGGSGKRLLDEQKVLQKTVTFITIQAMSVMGLMKNLEP